MNINKNFKKFRRRYNKGKNKNLNNIKLYNYAIIASNKGILKKNQLEAFRKTIIKLIKGNGKIICSIYPKISITKKPAEVRMGNGKGEIIDNIFCINKGNIIYEINSNNKNIVKLINFKGQKKLPIKTKIIYNNIFEQIKYLE